MSEEKILNIIDCWKNGDYVLTYSFNYYRAGKQNELLLKYITNLQQENKQLKEEIEEYKRIEQEDLIAFNNYDSILIELEEWLKEEIGHNVDGIKSFSGYQCKETLDKIQELKEKYK